MYRGNDLGNTYQPEATAFRLWAPTASDVQILLYDSETGPLKRQVAMLRSDNGTWYAQVSGDLQNWYYLYQVTVHGTTRYAVDPYVKAIAVNGVRGMIVHLPETNPPAWYEDDYVALALLMCSSSLCKRLPASMSMILISTTGAMIRATSMCPQEPMPQRPMGQLASLNASKWSKACITRVLE